MNTFNKSSIEKSILDIKLSKRPFICDCNRKHNTDSTSFDNRTESDSVVKSMSQYLTLKGVNKYEIIITQRR